MNTATAHGMPPEADVAEVLRRVDAGRTLSDAELEQHITDLRWLMERAYDRFQQHGNPADRDDAVLFMDRWYEAMASRRREVKEQLEEQALRKVQAAAGYFLDRADADRHAMAGRGA